MASAICINGDGAMCINVKLFDAIAAHGRGVTLEQARELLPAILPSSVTAAAYRLSSNGALELQPRGADDRLLRETGRATCRWARTAA
jgi:hypothetical protein